MTGTGSTFHRLGTRLCSNAPELLTGIAAFLSVVADLDPTGTYAWLPDGPGLTVDESFNVEQGVRLEVGSRYMLLGAITVRELFGTADELGGNAPLGYHLADHPPLGRYLLGIAHSIVTAVAMPADWPTPFVTAAARFGSAAAFACTVFLVANFATQRYGRTAGLVAAAGLVFMPRVFGHAHFAALESMIGLFYTATVLKFASGLEPPQSNEPTNSKKRVRTSQQTQPSLWVAGVAGLLFGLGMLTKVQAVLLPLPIAMCTFWHWRLKGVLPLAIFGGIGGAVFFAGWPWLWFSPVEHLLEYLGRTTDRLSLPVWYLGRTFADHEVPWHYPFVMFAFTVPVGLQALGLIGVWFRAGEKSGWREPAVQLLLSCAAFPLIVFALPGVAVYDGVRLFLVVFPLWAVLIGRGGAIVFESLKTRTDARTGAACLIVVVGSQAYGIATYRPAYLSYYNALLGGLAGAEKLGFEPTYWGDSITASLLETSAELVPDGSTIAVSPVLHQFQLDDLIAQSPVLRRRNIALVEYGTEETDGFEWVLLFRRKASLPGELHHPAEHGWDPLTIVERRGVLLGGLFRHGQKTVDAAERP